MTTQKVYLSGCFSTNWQGHIINNIAINEDFYFFDPRKNDIDIPKEYVTIDIHQLKQSDIVFALIEKDVKNQYGLAAEIGYAKALGKTIILVDATKERRFNFVRELCDNVFDNLCDAVEFLSTFAY